MLFSQIDAILRHYPALTLIALLLIVAIVIRLYLLIRRTRSAPVLKTVVIPLEEPTPQRWYQAAPALFTETEQLFCHELKRAIADLPYQLFGKIRIADLVVVAPEVARRDYLPTFNRISNKHVDFVLINPFFETILAIELDDSSHQQKHRQQRDAFVDEVFAQARIPLLHIPVQQRYQAEHIRALIIQAIDANEMTKPTNR